jgi:hypothetical protein
MAFVAEYGPSTKGNILLSFDCEADSVLVTVPDSIEYTYTIEGCNVIVDQEFGENGKADYFINADGDKIDILENAYVESWKFWDPIAGKDVEILTADKDDVQTYTGNGYSLTFHGDGGYEFSWSNGDEPLSKDNASPLNDFNIEYSLVYEDGLD